MIEFLKRWLRANASNKDVSEGEVLQMSGLCRDVLNYPKLFPQRNKLSFMGTLAEVYQHLQEQHCEILERSPSCAALAERCLQLGKNLVADAVVFLLMAPTDLEAAARLPSAEVVALWRSLPKPPPGQADATLQRLMRGSWTTTCGSVVAKLLMMPATHRLFGSPAADANGHVSFDDIAVFLARTREEFEGAPRRSCGLAGPFREPGASAFRLAYVDAAEAIFHLLFLLGDVLMHFQRVSSNLGDYGMIRVAPWLHHVLDAIIDKAAKLRGHLSAINGAADDAIVLAKARKEKVKGPVPTELQRVRAHSAFERAVTSPECHCALLVKAIEDMRARSAGERMPGIAQTMADARDELERVLVSPQFRRCVAAHFPELPRLFAAAAGPRRRALCCAEGLSLQDEEKSCQEPANSGEDAEPKRERGASWWDRWQFEANSGWGMELAAGGEVLVLRCL